MNTADTKRYIVEIVCDLDNLIADIYRQCGDIQGVMVMRSYIERIEMVKRKWQFILDNMP